MPQSDHAVVTGAFSYTGGFIARHLLEQNFQVTTLTRHPDHQNQFNGTVRTAPFDFSDKEALRKSMQGASVLYNTYWVRFERGDITFERAVENSKTLFEAAVDAGVSKIVHISIANPSPDSPLPYYSGKWRVEEALQNIGVPYAIIRPTWIFAKNDILMNNIAWALRRFPFYPLCGRGDYLVQPIYAEDLAAQSVAAASQTNNVIEDAAGPETFTFADLLRILADAMGVRTRLVKTPPSIGLVLTQLVGLMVRDVVLTRDEVDGLSAGLLASKNPPTGTTRFSSWLKDNAVVLGRRYESELKRNFRLQESNPSID